MGPDEKSMLYDSKEGSLERCVGMIEEQNDFITLTNTQPKINSQQ